jgi:LmbE family N-acetylglucosaminyl deacetylase
MSVLVVAAHPDDEVLGCGGTAARLAKEGRDVCIGILGEGITSRGANRDEAIPQTLAAIQEDCRRAASVLGAKDVVFFGLPDNRFDTVPMLEVVKAVEGLIQRVRPEVVYTHHAGDLNIDHRILHRAVVTATRPMPGCGVRRVYAFEVASSTEWAFGQCGPVFGPNVFVDISTTLETKLRAMRCYGTEARDFPHPRSVDALRAHAQRWGSVAGVAAAEAFVLLRAIE